MSDTTYILILVGALIACYFEMVRYDIELRSPRYLKPKGFFRMHDIEDGVLQLTTEEDIQVKHQYITNMWMETQDVVSDRGIDHKIQEVSQ